MKPPTPEFDAFVDRIYDEAVGFRQRHGKAQGGIIVHSEWEVLLREFATKQKWPVEDKFSMFGFSVRFNPDMDKTLIMMEKFPDVVGQTI